MIKVFFFFSQPIEKFNYQRFYFELFLKNGFEPIYVDLSNFFIKKNYNNKFNSKIKVLKVNSIADFILFLKKEKKNEFFFVDLTTYNSFIFNIFQKFLKLHGCIKLNLSTSTVSDFHLLTKKEKFIIYLKNLEFLKIIISSLRILRRILNNLFYVKADYTFISGRQELKKHKDDNSIILSSSLDYNKFLVSKKHNNLSKVDRLVYIDQNLLFHREFYVTKEGFLNKKNFTDYYNKLKIFFEYINKNNKYKIVICIHPRCKKDGINFLKKTFRSKSYLFSRNTSLEIQKSRLVILNYSTAHQLAVLYKKPMLLVHNLSKKYYDYELKKKIINTISKDLDLPIIDLNKSYKNKNIKFKYNKKKYEKYIKNYLSSIYPKKTLSWKIVIKKLKKINSDHQKKKKN